MNHQRRVVTFIQTRYFQFLKAVPEGISSLCEDVETGLTLWADVIVYGDPNDPTDQGDPLFRILKVTPDIQLHMDSDGHVMGATRSLTVFYTLSSARPKQPITEQLAPPVPRMTTEPYEIQNALQDLHALPRLATRLYELSVHLLTEEAVKIKDLGLFIQARNEINALLTILPTVIVGLTKREDHLMSERVVIDSEDSHEPPFPLKQEIVRFCKRWQEEKNCLPVIADIHEHVPNSTMNGRRRAIQILIESGELEAFAVGTTIGYRVPAPVKETELEGDYA